MSEPYAFDSFDGSWSYCHAPFPSGKTCALRRGHAEPCFEPRIAFPPQPPVTEPNGYCGPSPFVPVPPTQRMPEPCDCCGTIHPKKNLGQRLRTLP